MINFFCDNSKIPSFEGNKFNIFFFNCFYSHFFIFFSLLEFCMESQGVKSRVSFDLQDNSLIAFVYCLALMFLKVIGPYWSLVKSNNVVYCDFHQYVNAVQMYLKTGLMTPLNFQIFISSLFFHIYILHRLIIIQCISVERYFVILFP